MRVKLPRSRQGFTLIELMVVIAILGLIASGGTLVLSSGLQQAEGRASIQRLVGLMQWAGETSDQVGGALRLTYDLDAQTATIAGAHAAHKSLAFSRHHRLLAVLHDGVVVERGKVEIIIHSGASASYAVLTSSGADRRNWLVHFPSTSEIAQLKDSPEIQAQLRRLLANRPYLD